MKHIACALLLIVAFGTVFSSPALAFKRTAVGEDGYEFTLETLDGTSYTLSENLAEKATLLVFWASWSPRSHEALADFQKLHEKHANDGLQIIAVNVEHQEWDPSEENIIRAAVETAHVDFPAVVDKDYTVFNDYGVVAIPSIVMMDNTGTVTGLLDGYSNTMRDGFREEVLRKLGLFKEPEIVEKKDLTYKPKGISARYYYMGKKLADKKRYSRAIVQLERAVEIDQNYAAAYRTLAIVYNKLNRPEEANTALQRAEALETSNPVSEPTLNDK